MTSPWSAAASASVAPNRCWSCQAWMVALMVLGTACTSKSSQKRQLSPRDEQAMPQPTPNTDPVMPQAEDHALPLGSPIASVANAPSVTNQVQIKLKIVGENVVAYRIKSGPASTLTCADTAGYADEVSIARDALIDHSAFVGGAYAACILGRSTTGTWQAASHATRVEWLVDAAPPSGFRINPPTDANPSGDQVLTWSKAGDQTRVTYHVALAAADQGCQNPIYEAQTESTSLNLPLSTLPGGRFTACIKAADEMGQETPAENSDEIELDIKPILHLAWFTPAGNLIYAVRSRHADSWLMSQLMVSSEPSPGQQIGPHAELRLRADGLASLIATAVGSTLDSEYRQKLFIQQQLQPAGGFDQVVIAEDVTMHDVSDAIARKFSAQYDVHERLHVAHIGQQGAEHLLLYTISSAQNHEASTYAIERSTSGSFHDVALSVQSSTDINDEDTVHIAYIRDGSLFYSNGLAASGGQFKPPLQVSPSTCKTVRTVKLVTAPKGKIAAIFQCTEERDGSPLCTLRLAQSQVEHSDSWTQQTVATIDPIRACSPFNNSRPALAMGPKGDLHIAYRYTQTERDTEPNGAWDIAYTRVETDTVSTMPLAHWGRQTGSPSLTLDASGRPYLAYVGSDGLYLASGEPMTQREIVTIAAAGEQPMKVPPGSNLIDIATLTQYAEPTH